MANNGMQLRKALADGGLRGYLESMVEKVPESGCWVWMGTLREKGYGCLQIGGKMQRAHRVSYVAFIGDIPEGLQIDHLCRVKCCINPHHLEPVTNEENRNRWMLAKHGKSPT